MKVYTKVVIDMSTGETVEEESFDYTGPVALAKGGVSGGVSWPQWHSEIQMQWLIGQQDLNNPNPALPSNKSVEAYLSSLLDTNPFTAYTTNVPDASVYISPGETAVDAFENERKAFDPMGEWTSDFNAAKSAIDAALSADTTIRDIVDKFRQSQGLRFAAQVAKFAGSLADVGAVHSSQFVMGLALLVAEDAAEASRLEAEMRRNAYNTAVSAAVQVATQMQSSRLTKLQMSGAYAEAKTDIGFKRFTAEMDEYEKSVEISYRQTNWPFEVHRQAFEMLASAATGLGRGGPAPISQTQRAIGQAMAGAAIGAKVGTAVAPGVGSVVGAGIGAVVGAVTPFL